MILKIAFLELVSSTERYFPHSLSCGYHQCSLFDNFKSLLNLKTQKKKK